MFDKTYLALGGGHHTHRHENHTTITENRAPTDESVRLLKEMEAKAFNKITDIMFLELNGMNCEVVVALQAIDYMHYNQVRAALVFNFNGKKIETTFDMQRDLSVNDKVERIHKEIVDAIGREIVLQIASYKVRAEDGQFQGLLGRDAY